MERSSRHCSRGSAFWLGLRMTRARDRVDHPRDRGSRSFDLCARRRAESSHSESRPRELEILELIASGLSNREIAEKIFVSENTVKTHSSRLFDKLGAKRRTQAVQLGKEAGLIP